MLKHIILWLCYLYLVCGEDVIVTLPNGKIRGSSQTTARHKMKFYSFIGIPFAAPPVGNLRFMPPQPVANWEGILDTKSIHKECYQVQRPSSLENEDCLYISVYTPVNPGSSNRLPVVINIYGGAFIHGVQWGNNLKPQNVVEQNLVVVDFNYRVGPFGFLSSGDSVILGNMGLKDQQKALEWVQLNIHLFGGDPKKVTIMGQSAGAASVTYQILNPKSAGLFRAAVAQSASALCNWAYQTDPANIAYGLAAEIDPTFTKNKTTQELLQFLQSVDVSAIVKTGDKFHAFAPVLEVQNGLSVITQPMYESLEKGQINRVPLLIGFNSEEEIQAKGADPATTLDQMKRYYDHNPRLLVPGSMHINNDDEDLSVGEDIRKIYTSGNFAENISASVKYFSDNQYIRGVIKYAELQSQYTDVYLYQFSYHGAMAGDKVTIDGHYGVAHAEDLQYFWTYHTDLSPYAKADITTMDRYVILVSNFAKYLNPTPDANSDLLQNITWTKFNKNGYNYLDIDTNLQIKQNPREFSYQKWVNLYNSYGTKPYIFY